jgi:hypothetical protein
MPASGPEFYNNVTVGGGRRRSARTSKRFCRTSSKAGSNRAASSTRLDEVPDGYRAMNERSTNLAKRSLSRRRCQKKPGFGSKPLRRVLVLNQKLRHMLKIGPKALRSGPLEISPLLANPLEEPSIELLDTEVDLIG